MHKIAPDIGYCISKVLRDYSVVIEPDVCLLLSSPLWLGMNISKGNAYVPVGKDVIAYLNPLFLENFSVNANCLFLPVRGNSQEHFTYLIKRLKNQRKTLVKLSGGVLERDDRSANRPAAPVLGVIDHILEHPGSNGAVVDLVFSERSTLTLSEAEFVRYWHSDAASKINTEWFTLIPSQGRLTGPLIEQKLRAAFARQYHHLRCNRGSVVSGSAVLEFLQTSLGQGTGRYGDPATHFSLWRTGKGIIHLRKGYASALNKAEGMGPGIAALQKGMLGSVRAWEEFYGTLNRDMPVRQLADQYEALITKENELTENFKAFV
ncbi:MAG TPA: hypothetical protein VHC48_25105 [Puia sp.]|nr:hypothetical protein [Puia sp.]